MTTEENREHQLRSFLQPSGLRLRVLNSGIEKKNWQQCQTSEVVLGVATTLLVVKNSTLLHSIPSFSYFPFQALLARSTQPLDGQSLDTSDDIFEYLREEFE
jgi:hypothetical protein